MFVITFKPQFIFRPRFCNHHGVVPPDAVVWYAQNHFSVLDSLFQCSDNISVYTCSIFAKIFICHCKFCSKSQCRRKLENDCKVTRQIFLRRVTWTFKFITFVFQQQAHSIGSTKTTAGWQFVWILCCISINHFFQKQINNIHHVHVLKFISNYMQ